MILSIFQPKTLHFEIMRAFWFGFCIRARPTSPYDVTKHCEKLICKPGRLFKDMIVPLGNP